MNRWTTLAFGALLPLAAFAQVAEQAPHPLVDLDPPTPIPPHVRD